MKNPRSPQTLAISGFEEYPGKLLSVNQVYAFGGIGTLLAAIGFQSWVAVTATLAAALVNYLEYRRVEATLMGYNQAADTLYDIRTWWLSLPEADKANFKNFEKLVVNTEETIRSEHNSWLQDMQDRLANL
ncbi:MAG: SLATT domain-containing protein [Nodosilinea sp.]